MVLGSAEIWKLCINSEYNVEKCIFKVKSKVQNISEPINILDSTDC